MESIQHEWRPNPKQEKFLGLPDEVFEALYGGAAYGGKSEVLGVLPLLRGFISHPRFKGIHFRRTYGELEKEIIPRMMEFYQPTGASWNGSKREWVWSSGARIFAAHVEHEQDVRKYDTSEFNYMAFDELTSFTEFQYLYLAGSRCRSSHKDLPAIVRAGTNPGNIGNGWVKERFKVDSVPSLTIIKDKVTGKLRTYIQALPQDNTRVPKDKLADYLASLELLPPAEKRAKKYGDWSAFEGQVFSEFRIAHIPDEPHNALHVIDGMNLPSYWPIILAIDWGFAANAYRLWAKISPSGKVYLFRERADKKAYIEDWAAETSYISQNDNIVSVVIDPSAKQNRGDKKTIFQQVYEGLSEQLRDMLHVADNDRISGKMLVHEYLRFTPRSKRFDVQDKYNESLAMTILRTEGMESYKEYLSRFQEDKPENLEDLPKLQIFNNCKLLIDVIPSCVYDDVRKEDVKDFDGDDPYDTLRYLLKEVDVYVHDSKRAFDKIKRNNEIEERLERTKDYNRYFMDLRREEDNNEDLPKRRFRGRSKILSY